MYHKNTLTGEFVYTTIAWDKGHVYEMYTYDKETNRWNQDPALVPFSELGDLVESRTLVDLAPTLEGVSSFTN